MAFSNLKNELELELSHELGKISRQEGFQGEKKISIPTELFQEYLRNDLVKRLYLTDVGYYPHAMGHYMARPMGCGEYIFFYCIEGKGYIEVESREYEINAGEAFCIPMWKPHYYYADETDPWSILWVHFKGEDIKYYPLDDCEKIVFNSDFATNRMMLLFDLLFRVLTKSYTLGNFIYISQVLSIILGETYMREKTSDDNRDQNQTISDIIKYMSFRLNQRITLEELSESFKISKSNINELFIKYTKKTPIDFFICMKIDRACKLLKSTDMKIYQVAIEVGYSDPYFFSRIFKHVVGLSPKKYRESPMAVIEGYEM